MPSDLLGAHLDTYSERTERDVRIAQGLVKRFRYKPDWHVDITRAPELGGAALRIQMFVTDSRGLSATKIAITGKWALPKLRGMADPEKAFWTLLHACIKVMEMHEMDEWFRVDGELPFDPHKGDR